MKVEPGDPVILFSGPNNIYLTQIPKEDHKIPNKQSEANIKNKRLIHNKKGIFDLASCIGKFYGQKYRADISLIILLLDLIPGKRVLECGTGSGSLSYALASAVSPNGHVFTFDFHQQRIQYSLDLFEKTKISDMITVTEADAYSDKAFLVSGSTHSITEHSIDSVFLDVPSPWNCINNVTHVIKVRYGACSNCTSLTTSNIILSTSISIFITSILSTLTILIINILSVILLSSGSVIRTFEVLTKPWGISFSNPDDTDSDDEGSDLTSIHMINKDVNDSGEILGKYVNYQLPQFNHTGYITVATSNIY
ncbi:uncharacterized protein TA15390 [Theileria annulata]|uniref:tRNA (adenine(58)-N(1))-methyltransferase n=1 Tax=Theileria annulata TaxID=5874 RepID=Q4UFG9_THEAN|nr:uncharacterized protein TA15390 [Theileria annulata]CAI74147.1 hypothetical protein, conserved [Theileria annulata]|eukprot:XP_951879.1 hypothetical protein, conserved [Theileria annulata]